jgi:hypothetical protein
MSLSLPEGSFAMDMRDPAIFLSATATQGMPTERLPFTVRRVDTEDALWKAVRVRHAAYARHVPDFARTLSMPEACDYADDTVVLIAES